MGGLGNQFFQYLFALRQRELTGAHVLLLLDWFQNNQLIGRAKDRPLQIPMLFDLSLEMTTLGLAAERGLIFPRLFRFEQEGGVECLPRVADGNLLCMGYYQTAAAMPSLESLHRCMTGIPVPTNGPVGDRSIVALHVRLGDYKQLQHVLPILPLQYYALALESLPNSSRYLVFAEDVTEAKDFLSPLGGRYPFEFHTTSTPIEDFKLLASMPNIICANSTFSFLAGWVAKFRGARVLAPDAKFWHAAHLTAEIAGKHSLIQMAGFEVVV